MEFLSSIYGLYKEEIIVTINRNSILEDLDGNYLQTEKMTVEIPFQLIVISDSEKAAAQTQSTSSIISVLLTFGTSISIQFLLGGTIEATWLLLGTLQMMALVPLINLNLPANFREFSKNLAMLNGEPTVIPNLFDEYYKTLEIDRTPYNSYFYMMNFKTNFLLLNAGRKVELWMIVAILSYISYLFMDCTLGFGSCGRIASKIDFRLRYGFIIRAISQSYLTLVLST